MARSRLCSADLIIRGDSIISGTSQGRVLLTAPAETYNRPAVRTFHFHEGPHGDASAELSIRSCVVR
jgi:hypothetical protein